MGYTNVITEQAAADALVPATDQGVAAPTELDAASPEAAPAPEVETPVSVEIDAAPASAEAPAERALPFDVEHLGLLRRSVLDHLADTEGPQSVAQILAAMPAGTTRGSGESAIRREWEADRIERVGAGLYVLGKPKPPKQAKPAPQPSPTEESTWLARLDAWATDPSSWDVEAFGPPPDQSNNIPADIKARFNDRVRKRAERRREAEAAATARTAADAELRAKLLAATGGNFQPGPALDDVAPIRLAMELVPIDRILSSVRNKTDRRMYPANEPATSWREQRLLLEIAESYCRTEIVPRLVDAWSKASAKFRPEYFSGLTHEGSPPQTSLIGDSELSAAGDMPDDIVDRSQHDSRQHRPGRTPCPCQMPP